MIEEKLTNWEIGQELIAMSDYVVLRVESIEDEEIHREANKFRAYLGDKLDELGSHVFGIYDTQDFDDDYNKGDK